jgi:crotonobetainyl-CoA:carnitine CoA-transferase CaiB-like acyl-CoA transferase
MAGENGSFLLSPYRILDLTDERGLLCGKILADLGADVVQVEPPGGSTARNIGPYYKDDVHPERSLFWWAYAVNKRGITLNLHTERGRELLKHLVKGSHFLIESYSPGYLDGLGLGYKDLEALNPSLVMVSITPFGQDGPYAHYKASDIVGMAMGGFMYLTGDSDRPPLRVSFPQFYLHGSAAGATGAMIAHTHRAITGEGQHVDVSCQQAVARSLAHAPQSWDLEGEILKRMGPFRQTGKETLTRTNWRCKDGYVNYMLQGGGPGVSRSTRALLEWMDEEGMGDEDLKAVDWESLGYGRVRADIMEKSVGPLQRFFDTHTREELTKASVERRILLFPVATPANILEHPQLKARDYFKELPHPELNISVTYPGLFVKDFGGERVGLRRRPPLIGEHNREIYQNELGLTPEELTSLEEGGVI